MLLERLISLVAPHNCLVCGDEGLLLCTGCMYSNLTRFPARCYRCHTLSPHSKVCTKCRRHSSLGHVWVAAEYKEVNEQLVHQLKFGNASAAARPMALVMLESLPYMSHNIVAHVPTSSQRVRGRGYDQAKLLAKELARTRQLPFASLLIRLGHTRQLGANRRTRIQQLAGMFSPVHPYLLHGAYILLVDDVLTTGATLEETARTLKKAGAKRVDAIVFAQKK